MVVFCLCAAWPQGLVLCIGDDGHIDFEPPGAGCRPTGSDATGRSTLVAPSDRDGCLDTPGQDLSGVRASARIAPPATSPLLPTIPLRAPALTPLGAAGVRPPSAIGPERVVLLI